MTIDKILVTLAGLGGIAAIYWFFFGKREAGGMVSDEQTILVEGGYKPSTVYIKKDRPATLTFIRKDPNSCLEEVVFPDYKIKEYLPLGQAVKIILPAPHKEESSFHCGMNMYFGKLKTK